MFEEVLTYILFVIGFILLIKGSDFLVIGASSLAKRLKISDMVVGLTIVSIGTSSPELFVNVVSSFTGNAGIGIGNVIGSNIANILLILGVSAIIFPLPVKENTVLTEIPFSLTATLLVGFLANASLFQYIELDTLSITRTLYISRWDGIILIVFFILFMAYIIKIANEQAYKGKINQLMGIENDNESKIELLNNKKTLIYILIGIISLSLGGKWVVDGAILIANKLELSDSFIGLTIIAFGTSLPELATSINAALKQKTDIAVGNVIGSNIFNLLWILGVSALIIPLPFELISNTDLVIIIGSSALLIFSLTLGKKYVIERWNGIIFIFVYIIYIIYLVNRG